MKIRKTFLLDEVLMKNLEEEAAKQFKSLTSLLTDIIVQYSSKSRGKTTSTPPPTPITPHPTESRRAGKSKMDWSHCVVTGTDLRFPWRCPNCDMLSYEMIQTVRDVEPDTRLRVASLSERIAYCAECHAKDISLEQKDIGDDEEIERLKAESLAKLPKIY